MSYQRQVFTPIIKGTYWREIINTYKDIDVIDGDLELNLLKNHPRKGEVFTFPYSHELIRMTPKQEDLQRDIFKLQSFAIDFFKKYRQQITNAYRFILENFNEIRQQCFNLRILNNSKLQIVERCLGVRQNALSYKRTVAQKIRHAWFYSCQTKYFRDLERFFFAHIILNIDIEEVSVWPIDPIQRVFSPSKTINTVKWVAIHLENKASNVNLPNVYRCVDSLDFSTRTLKPLADLEVFRGMANRIWSGDPHSEELQAIELLLLDEIIGEVKSTFIDWRKLPKKFMVNQLDELTHFGRKSYLEYGSEINIYRPITLIVANLFLDFWKELDHFNKYESYKGTFTCQNCGTFIQRSYDAYGQKYCSQQCKKRVNRRNHQARKKLQGKLLNQGR